MSFKDLVITAQTYFPDLKLKYKNQSWFMRLIGFLLFFNKSFMNNFTTTIGSKVYYPTESFVKARPVSAAVILLHELVHVKDAKRLSFPLFGFLYLFPQILSLFCLPLFLISWKIALPLVILFALPLPAFFRMYFEKKAYLTSLYAIYQLGKRMNFRPLLTEQKNDFLNHFKNSHYYFMWPFSNLQQEFDEAEAKIEVGQRPFEDPFFDIIDDLISKM